MIEDTTSRLRLLAAPVGEPLSLSEAKSFLRIDHTADDATITRAIVAARQAAEEYLRLLLLPQTYSFEVTGLCHVLPLPVGPAQTIQDIYAYDAEGNATEVNAANYRLSLDGHSVIFASIHAAASYLIEFEAGMASDAASVPALIKQGMLHHIAVLMEQRAASAPMPVQSLQCYQPYRRARL